MRATVLPGSGGMLDSGCAIRCSDHWGALLGLGDRPVPGDYDGDGLHDLAVYREATGVWYILKSNGTGLATYTWGAPGDYPARR